MTIDSYKHYIRHVPIYFIFKHYFWKLRVTIYWFLTGPIKINICWTLWLCVTWGSHNYWLSTHLFNWVNIWRQLYLLFQYSLGKSCKRWDARVWNDLLSLCSFFLSVQIKRLHMRMHDWMLCHVLTSDNWLLTSEVSFILFNPSICLETHE